MRKAVSLFNRAEFGPGPVLPNNLLRHKLLVRAVWFQRSATHALEVFGCEAKLGEDFFVRNAFATRE